MLLYVTEQTCFSPSDPRVFKSLSVSILYEVQMAREELYHAAEYALRLHKLLRNVDEQQGLEGWEIGRAHV